MRVPVTLDTDQKPIITIGTDTIAYLDGYFPILNPDRTLRKISKTLPLLVDLANKEWALCGKELAPHLPFRGADLTEVRLSMMRYFIDQFFRLASLRLSELASGELKERRRNYKRASNPDERKARAAVLAAGIAHHIKTQLELAQTSKAGIPTGQVSASILKQLEPLYTDLYTKLLPHVPLRGGHRGTIKDVDGILAAIAPEVMKIAMMTPEFVLKDLCLRLAHAKREIKVVGKAMLAIVNAEEHVCDEGVRFQNCRSEMRGAIEQYIKAQLASIDTLGSAPYPVCDNVYVDDVVSEGALKRIIGSIGRSSMAARSLEAGIDVVRPMAYTRNAMPVRVNGFLAITSCTRLLRTMRSIARGSEALQKAGAAPLIESAFEVTFAYIREFYAEADAEAQSYLTVRFNEAHDKLAGLYRPLNISSLNISSLNTSSRDSDEQLFHLQTKWLADCSDFMRATALEVWKLKPRMWSALIKMRRDLHTELEKLVAGAATIENPKT